MNAALRAAARGFTDEDIADVIEALARLRERAV